MNSVRLIKQAEQQSTPARTKHQNPQANAFTTVRNWIKEREMGSQISPQSAFANLFTCVNASSPVKVS